jgi:hypothetical protein
MITGSIELQHYTRILGVIREPLCSGKKKQSEKSEIYSTKNPENDPFGVDLESQIYSNS